MTKAPTARPVWHGPPALRKLLVPIGLLAPHPLNAREHDLPAIMESLKELGQQKPIVLVPVGRVHPEFPTIVAGHGTTFAARELGWSHIAAVESDLADADVERFVLADNRTSDRAGYNDEALARLLQHAQDRGSLRGTGYDRDDLDSLLADLRLRARRNAQRGEPDAVPPMPAEAASKPGEVYALGDHVLVCGDAREAATYDLLLDGPADLVWTDPPYGVDVVGGSAKPKHKRRAQGHRDIENDTLTADELDEFLRSALGLAYEHSRPGANWYVASPTSDMADVFTRVLQDLGVRRWTLVWVKDRMVLSRMDYHPRHELIHYGWKSGGNRVRPSIRTLTTVLEIPPAATVDRAPDDEAGRAGRDRGRAQLPAGRRGARPVRRSWRDTHRVREPRTPRTAHRAGPQVLRRDPPAVRHLRAAT